DEDDVMEEELARRRRRLMRRYKIQEVIKRRQIMLIQVVKEERGNKGAALTTYLSLAGRYCVLMPNTARGGGVSRKITSASDRKRLKGVIQSMDVPDGMGLIVRTAGAKRTKAEIKRDYEYLSRLWENIRDVTLKSVAPALIYEEEDLVKRAIRDMYDKDLDGIVVEGEEGFREARDFMRMIMPSQAKKITAYREPTPLFIKSRVEDTLAQIYSPVVPLRSGGYLVINQTEALVAIDVNSGKATRERNIEATALKTNMEAAEEAARQMRLRDLAGLIVIDFIDMEEAKNNRAVEKKVKDSLKDDRARIQMGKISQFGLMEISRQRRRAGVLEGTTHVCPHCQGVGRVRSVESSALSMLRSVELEAAKNGPGVINLRVPSATALYILNEKRAYLMRLQQQQGLTVNVLVDDNLTDVDHEIERVATLTGEEARAFIAPARALPEPEEDLDVFDEDEEDEEEEEEDGDEAEIEAEDTDDDEASARRAGREPREAREAREDGGRGGRRRRRRRGPRRDDVEEHRAEGEGREEAEGPEAEGDEDEGDDRGSRRRRRRGRRGGRRAREEVRAADPYSWVRVRVPHVDGVYGWYDPALAMPQARPAEAQPAEARQRGEARSEARPEPAPARVAAAPAASDQDIWVELPASEDKPSRSRRSRSRGRGRGAAPADAAEAAVIEALVEAPIVAEPEPEPAPAAEPAPAPTRSRARKPKAAAPDAAEAAVIEASEPEVVMEAAAVPEPVAAVAAPAPAPEPDPNEISAPPAQPKRGWWRR
ncbi:MAG: Rne/Rng family ribonuclease, partial [Caulobacteraceae bacterium]